MERIECWRICSGLVQAEIGFLQIGKRKTRLQILRFAFQLKEMLGQQQIPTTTRLADTDIVSRPGRCGLPQAINVKPHMVAEAPGGATAVAKRRGDCAPGLSRPYQHRGVENKVAAGHAHDIPVRETKRLCVAFGDMQRIAPNLLGKRFWALLKPGVIGEATVEYGGVRREYQSERVLVSRWRDFRHLRGWQRNCFPALLAMTPSCNVCRHQSSKLPF